MRPSKLQRLRHCLALALLVVAGRADAEQTGYFSTNAALTGGASMAYDQSGGAAWLNPAGLAGVADSRVDASATAFVLRARDYSGALVVDLPSGHSALDQVNLDISPVPAALAFVRRLHPRLWAALGVFVTDFEIINLKLSQTSTEMFPGNPHPVTLTYRGASNLVGQTYRIGPAFGIAAHPRLRVGVGVYAVYASFRSTLNLSAGAIDQDGTASPSMFAGEIVSQWQITTFGGELVAGLQWNPLAGLHLGLTLRSPVLGVYSDGSVYNSQAGVTTGSAFPGQPSAMSGEVPMESTAGKMIEPFQLTLGLAYRFARGAIGVELDYRLPIAVKELSIDDSDLWNVRAGGQVKVPRNFVLGGGLFTDRTPKRTLLYPADSRADYYGCAFSVGKTSTYALKPAPNPKNLVFQTVVTATYALGLSTVSGVHYAPTATTVEELAKLLPLSSQAFFHTATLQISSSLSF